jgi:hypothetical protein
VLNFRLNRDFRVSLYCASSPAGAQQPGPDPVAAGDTAAGARPLRRPVAARPGPTPT